MRPRKTDENKLSKVVSFRLTEADYLPLEARAKQAGLRPNELARMVVMQGPTMPAPAIEQRLDPAFIKGIQTIGVTLLRIEKDLKQGSQVLPELSSTLVLISGVVEEAVLRRVPS